MAETKKKNVNPPIQDRTTVYYGVSGSQALQPEIIKQPERKAKTRKAIHSKTDEKARVKLRTVGIVAAATVMACILVQRCAVIAVQNIELQNAASAVETLEKEEAYLDIEIAGRGDVGMIKDIAQNQLHMGYPKNEQIYYFNYAATQKSEPLTEMKKENNLFDRICDWVYDLGRRICS